MTKINSALAESIVSQEDAKFYLETLQKIDSVLGIMDFTKDEIPGNIKMLAEKIIKGGQGNWGEIPMAGHPNVSEEDASAMVEYILSMKK
jgi:cytochrome c